MVEVRVFSTPTCPKCSALKDHLAEKNIDYEDIDVVGNFAAQNEMVQNTGSMTVPQIQIDGKQYIVEDIDNARRLLENVS